MGLYDERVLFEAGPRKKAHNDEDNKKREDIIRDLFSPDEDVRRKYLAHPSNGSFWKSIRDGFDAALKGFRSPPKSEVPGPYIINLEKAAGRKQRFDYIAKTLWADDSSGLKLEFKRGHSIFDQPQFLSLYAKRGKVTHVDVVSYPEYLFENFDNELEKISGVKLPSQAEYLSNVFGTNYGSMPIFKALYDATKTGSRGALLDLQYRSINNYLKFLGTKENMIDTNAFQSELTSQREKLFVSWDTATQDFNVEQFTLDDITLKGSVSLKAGRNGLNVVEFENLAGNKIEALLRWKNGPCVLGPAWQIGLRASSTAGIAI
jgi:hypothetical protein